MADGKKIAILGAGESGTGSALLAQKMGYEVFVSDAGKIPEKYREELQEQGIVFEEGGHSLDRLTGAAEVIKSPGIPPTAPVVQRLKEAGLPLIAEIEFAGRYTDARMIGITGSNGKTTTTLLTHHLLERAGLKVGLGGNVGKSFARQVAAGDHDYYVLELSSFQLDDMYRFRTHIAILTNITPDHLDRYEHRFENYIDSKFRILQNQQESDSFIYCLDDEGTRRGLASHRPVAKQYPFSINEKVDQGAFLDNNELTVKTAHNTFNMTIAELALQGKHNLYNSMAAAIAAKVLDLRNEVVRESLGDFKNVEHRLEQVGKIQGIEFINDSKATNVNATWYALESMTSPVIWIAGGVDKGNDYSMLKPVVREKVKAIVCLGKDNGKIHEAFEEDAEIIVNTLSAREAVGVAYHLAAKGDTVLLSPACASFDLFKNYEDRGNQFKEAVKQL
ncbi:UDP-N-acetylmuramoylalanine--D-glutamate ligase [Anseongella ginsenosidimutans]|uniref:UDP-N-acetylmuramoylalanine--D-glutamate ligase n=1 Tax=Anseongella ginsenosidimutans TaxID=496056 RepID=A0A4R3KZ88_9SPHI|nr:UDP-N-acetylmuramoyl-L-alanine--D-glutamate ligase [Anseongella ginsenosidimutans]QEC50976.1 UDP-N-acetylmuramoyl-L-alanine--D-glutamate ligase [Anseongella ginsenosidimutans]TCS90376.1 UDP-N-acetylmuramoylalanine--D-glutamate ligase [Anseongella ginsenosidimutans]